MIRHVQTTVQKVSCCPWCVLCIVFLIAFCCCLALPLVSLVIHLFQQCLQAISLVFACGGRHTGQLHELSDLCRFAGCTSKSDFAAIQHFLQGVDSDFQDAVALDQCRRDAHALYRPSQQQASLHRLRGAGVAHMQAVLENLHLAGALFNIFY